MNANDTHPMERFNRALSEIYRVMDEVLRDTLNSRSTLLAHLQTGGSLDIHAPTRPKSRRLSETI